jgi:hypothetical protein
MNSRYQVINIVNKETLTEEEIKDGLIFVPYMCVEKNDKDIGNESE